MKGLGKVYVRFADKAAAAKARGVLHGRMFDGSKVEGEFIAEEAFHAIEAGKALNNLSDELKQSKWA